MPHIFIASDVIELAYDHQLYTLVFTDEYDELNSLIHFNSEYALYDYCKVYNVDIITADREYGCVAMDWYTGTPVYYDEHIIYASAI